VQRLAALAGVQAASAGVRQRRLYRSGFLLLLLRHHAALPTLLPDDAAAALQALALLLLLQRPCADAARDALRWPHTRA
jgi:hypothetical protein